MSSDDDTLERTIDQYRQKIDFDETAQISHPQDCYPGNCSLVGYKKDGELAFQEQTGKYPVVDESTPDWNPRGCGRQCSYTDATYGDERIEQPMKQVGGRDSGEWEPISWEEAYREIAEHMVDAIEENPQSIINEIPPGEGGATYGITPFVRLVSQAGGVNLDLESATIQDFSAGLYQTFGKFQFAGSQDEWFKADVNVVWHMNPAYSRQSSYHFITESRYHGGETIVIAPDYSPSCVHADKYVPVEPASDAALALGMCQYLLAVEADLVDWAFVKEQTDMPLLVREDDDRFLREADVTADGSDDRFYVWDRADGLTAAPVETLELGEIDPALEGSFEVEVRDGDGGTETVTVRPVMERVRERVAEYDPETVQDIVGVHPDVVAELAETFAEKHVNVLNSWNTCKIFHGDLIERAMSLVLALTGNWGREGTGIRSWSVIYEPGAAGEQTATDPMLKRLVRGATDRELTEEKVDTLAQEKMFEMGSVAVPAAFFWYRHAGYDEVWEQAPMESAEMPRQIGEYLEEAVERGWWSGVDLPEADVDPNVMFFVANNALRNKSGTKRTYLQELWPKLDLAVSVDYRWSTTALHSDIVLPATFHHEKEQFHTITSPEIRFWAYADQAIDPVGDAKNEMEIMEGIASAVEAVADDRGLDTYEVPHGVTADDFNDIMNTEESGFGEIEALPPEFEKTVGPVRHYDDFYDKVVGGLTLISEKDYHKDDVNPFSSDEIEQFMRNTVDHCVDTGVFADGTTLEDVKERGFAKYEGTGETAYGMNQASRVEPDDTVTALDKHVADKRVYPSLTGRAQFYIDHEWFLEADEQLPRYKRPPADHGGDREEYPFYITSGHNRHSTHAITQTNETQMNLHRGEPHLFINREAAAAKGIEDGQYVRVHNNYGEAYVQAKVSSQPAEDQVVFYHAWDPYLYPEGKGLKDLIPGLVKPTHFAGGYGHLTYRWVNWQQQQINRHVSVDVEPVDAADLDL